MSNTRTSTATTSAYELFIDGRDDPLSVVSFTGKEALSKLYSFEVRISCADNLFNPLGVVPASPFLRARALLKMSSGATVRFVRGIVASIVPEGETTTVAGVPPEQFLKFRIAPTLWFAKHRIRSRVFQNKSIPAIVEEILRSRDYTNLGVLLTLDLQQTYAEREYCMQYQESDYAFIRRILSEEGIFWYFDHGTEDAVTDAENLILLDTPSYPGLDLADSTPVPHTLELPALSSDATPATPTKLASFELKHAVKPTALLLRDYDYEHPNLDVTASAPTVARPTTEFANNENEMERWGTWESDSRGRETRAEYGGTEQVQAIDCPNCGWLHAPEMKECPVKLDDGTLMDISGEPVTTRTVAVEGSEAQMLSGGSGERRFRNWRSSRYAAFDRAAAAQLRVYEHHCALGSDRVDDPRAQRRLEQYTRNAARAKGTGFCRHLAPGYRFTLQIAVPGVSNFDQDYVVTKVEHVGFEDGSMTAILPTAQLQQRYWNRFECVPAAVLYRPRQRPKIRKEAIESATVVGPAGHEIHTDKLGRVKVQFHWDLHGSMNENSCCFVRVMQSWSGTAYGAQFLPRVGTEVLVSFREGDHDRPVVIGSVYNGVQPHPFLPPEGQTRSGFRTRSTPGGSGYNELSFDDNAGKERVFLRAQTDFETFVGRDRKTNVEGCEVKQVEGKQTERISADADRAVGGDEQLRVEGCRRDLVEGRSETKVGQDRWVEVGGAEHHLIEGTGKLHAGDDLTTETEGNHATIIGKHDAKRSFALHVEGVSQLQSTGITEIVSPQGLRLRCGNSIVEIMQDQILMVSDKIMLHAPGTQVELRKEGEFWVDADQQAVVKANKVTLKGLPSMLELGARAVLRGPKISLSKPKPVAGLDETERELTTIELKDEDNKPCPNQRYIMVFADGGEQSGFLDDNGKAEIFLEEGATIRFPGLIDVAKGAAQ